MTVIEFSRPNDARIVEFCKWQCQQPKFLTKAEWREAAYAAGFTDIRDSDMARVVAKLRELAAAEYHHANLLEAERDGKRVIEIDDDDAEAADTFHSERLKKMHFEGVTLNDLSASLGSPEEWLATAVIHLKIAECEQKGPMITVSQAAVALLLYRVEQLEYGGEPWKGNAV